MKKFACKWEWEKLISMKILQIGESIEGITYVTDGAKWGAMDYNREPIIPILYDFIDCDEYEYGSLWIVCGKNGYHYMKNGRIHYSGIYDIYDFKGQLITQNATSYDNGNHEISCIMKLD